LFTILIPVFKSYFLDSQLYWLSKQIYKDFNVLIMDAAYKENRHKPFMQRKYPFRLYHVPLVHNTLVAKRFDNSVLNNLALLAPTFHFIFLSETSYPTPEFTQSVAKSLFSHCRGPSFSSLALPHTAYSRDVSTVLASTCKAVTTLTDKSTFIYVLNGVDEATTAGYCVNVALPALYDVNETITGVLYQFDVPDSTVVADRWRQPCEKCSSVFSILAIRMATSVDDFVRSSSDPELVDQMTFFEPEIETMMFQCPNCGFGGVVSPLEYQLP
jgi:hypothetical protein